MSSHLCKASGAKTHEDKNIQRPHESRPVRDIAKQSSQMPSDRSVLNHTVPSPPSLGRQSLSFSRFGLGGEDLRQQNVAHVVPVRDEP